MSSTDIVLLLLLFGFFLSMSILLLACFSRYNSEIYTDIEHDENNEQEPLFPRDLYPRRHRYFNRWTGSRGAATYANSSNSSDTEFTNTTLMDRYI